MPRKPTFAVDCDDVLADFTTPMLEVIFQVTGERYTLEDFKEWDYLNDPRIYPHRREIWDRIKVPGIGLTYNVIPGVRKGLHQLRKVANVFVCTAGMQGENFVADRVKWLKRLGFDFKTEMVFTCNKRLIRADVLVDDNPENVNFFKVTHPDSVAVLWKPPGRTKDYPVMEGVEKASDWGTLVDLARRLRCH